MAHDYTTHELLREIRDLLLPKRSASEPDPMLIEARKIISDNYGDTRMADGSLALGEGPRRVEAICSGKGDEYWEVRVVLAALRRGMELSKQEPTP